MPSLTAVIDVGKTHSKLLVLRPSGEPVGSWRMGTCSIDGGAGYPALDHLAMQAWIRDTLASLGKDRSSLRQIIVTTHGAAFAGLAQDRLALPIADYEFAGFDSRAEGWESQLDPFAQSFSPNLTRGLNAAAQFDWLERHCATAFREVDTWLPYPQYWAWWLTGIKASEVSSLGCHTQLWRPRESGFSGLAVRREWAQKFAPLRRAWDVLGPVRPQLAHELGLSPETMVHCGVHDSNACLARYLRAWPRMTLVSSGTWTVVMAPGTPVGDLDARLDFMANVSVRNEAVPTGRFMGGREIETLCAGADPALANTESLRALLCRGVQVLPGLGALGGPFAGRHGCILKDGQRIALTDIARHFDPAERATLAAMHTAYSTAWIIDHLRASAPIAVDGPLAANAVYCQLLAALMPRDSVNVSVDSVEGTARGSWVLTLWTSHADLRPQTFTVPSSSNDALARTHYAAWLTHISDRESNS